MPFLKLDARAARVWQGKTKKATSVSRACLNAAAMALNLQMPADVCPAFCLAFMRGSFPPHTLRSMIGRFVAGIGAIFCCHHHTLREAQRMVSLTAGLLLGLSVAVWPSFRFLTLHNCCSCPMQTAHGNVRRCAHFSQRPGSFTRRRALPVHVALLLSHSRSCLFAALAVKRQCKELQVAWNTS